MIATTRDKNFLRNLTISLALAPVIEDTIVMMNRDLFVGVLQDAELDIVEHYGELAVATTLGHAALEIELVGVAVANLENNGEDTPQAIGKLSSDIHEVMCKAEILSRANDHLVVWSCYRG